MRAWGLLAAAVALAVGASGCAIKPAPDASNDFVSSKKYTKLFVELDYAEGFKPRSNAVDALKRHANDRLSKPGGVTVDEKGFPGSQSVYSTSDLRAVESARRDRQPSGDTMVLYVLYVNGHHADDTGSGKVLGVQFGRASIAVFKESVDNSGGLPGLNFNAATVEQAVLTHEFGHTIGLVNNGLAMVRNHEDGSHPKHSTSEASVMYWAIENTSGLPLLDRIPTEFDEDDKADIRGAGGR